MLLNSELPKEMLKYNSVLNDYDFILYHLYKNNVHYREWFNSHRSQSRVSILDNSAYEFYVKGEDLDISDFARCIYQLKPSIFILPDKLMDMEKTLELTHEFLNHICDNYGIYGSDVFDYSDAMGVIQGNTSEEMMQCFREYVELGIYHIAVPFHNSFFKDIVPDVDILLEFKKYYGQNITEDHKYAMGRIQWMRDNSEYFEKLKWVHMLGSHCPLEAKFYNYNSMDTGYPVKCAMAGVKLFNESSKPNIIIDEFFNSDLSASERMLIIDNLSAWHNVCLEK